MKRSAAATSLAIAVAFAADAQTPGFHPGTLFPEYSQVAPVDLDVALPEDAAFKVSFDVVEPARASAPNRSFTTAARFIDMHVENGVSPGDIRIALVVHGGAVFDVTRPERYRAARGSGTDNPSADLVAALIEHGVEIHVCGQSAAAHGVVNADLLPGVKMSLSAMTSHALLQQQGYTLNPF